MSKLYATTTPNTGQGPAAPAVSGNLLAQRTAGNAVAAGPDMIACAQRLAVVLGPLQAAEDETEAGLSMAEANAGMLLAGWCQCAHALDECYFRREADGAHGWMCSRCRKLTQTG